LSDRRPALNRRSSFDMAGLYSSQLAKVAESQPPSKNSKELSYE
jgi:hypothetical protein